MENLIATTPEAIRTAAGALRKLRPVYTQVIDYYEQIFTAQASAGAAMDVPEIHIPQNRLQVKREEGFPLITPPEFPRDTAAAGDLMTDICRITASSGLQTSAAAGKLEAALKSGAVNADELFAGLLKEALSTIDAVAERLEMDPRLIRIMSYHSLKPCFEISADRLSQHLGEKEDAEKEYCPVCGSQPVLATLGKNGERHHYCNLCWYRWPFRRARCPFCEVREDRLLVYFYSESEKEYRVDICEKCHTYMKCIDLRETDRVIYPPLELAATLHLDMKAQEAGYQSVPHLLY